MRPSSPQSILVVPCYNEEERFPTKLFDDFLNHYPTVSCLFVNDGSQDRTENLLKNFCENHVNASYISLPSNVGKAEAVRVGMLKALEGHSLYAGFWDADLATPLDEVERFLDIFSTKPDVQLVTGARVQLLGRNIKRKMLRHYVGRVFATLASYVLQTPIYDTQCGAKIFKVNTELKELFLRPFVSRWIFDVEVLMRMGPRIKHVYELPLQSWQDIGKSKVKFFDFIKASYELVLIYFQKKKYNSHHKDLHFDPH